VTFIVHIFILLAGQLSWPYAYRPKSTYIQIMVAICELRVGVWESIVCLYVYVVCIHTVFVVDMARPMCNALPNYCM